MSTSPNSGGQRTNEQMVLVGLGLFALVTVGPGLLVAFKAQAVRFLLEHHLVVRASEAVLEIPSTDIGLDLRRLVVLVLCLPLLAFVARRFVRTSPQTPARPQR